jgi:hypothetical protein
MARTNAYTHDTHIGKPVIRKHFWHNNECYCHNNDKRNNTEWFSKKTIKGWIVVDTTIDLELAFELRKSRRLI